MSVRLLLTDSIFRRIEKILNEIKSKVGRPPVISDRLFIEAVLYVARNRRVCLWLSEVTNPPVRR